MDRRNWWVAPGLGIGPFRFGTPRGELRAALGTCRPFRRTPDSVDLTDDYPDGVQLTCSPGEGLYLIEIHEPVGVHHLGVPLHGRVRDVVAALRAAGVAVTKDDEDEGWIVAGGAAMLATQAGSHVEIVTAYSPRRAGARVVDFGAGPAAVKPLRSYTVLPGRGLTALALGTHRDAVRATRNGGVALVGYPDEDSFVNEGLTVTYDAAGRAVRVTVTQAGAVLLDGVNLLPSRPRTIADVRAALSAAGHEVAEEEAAVLIPGAGIEIWTARPGPSRPVCAVSVVAP
ncbi:hypothetical protein [Dactylosporangium matsuzakiense]|uniref:Uncharacterized protein n=1 Tax=Dactylosporangium matsuzakiense TaxID=53360 RepID=A0A9W6NS80_9ACTN|nr:hypothetical protein [Dactylosporangium matsuzakiense]UWZ41482.1 hypothetical protein Dmats_27895 [Dactylosporangium matsuzakiense]GLL07046.1 hypothetical protein GCM10017581_087970 [Dactylosporangium matsuzakiense]